MVRFRSLKDTPLVVSSSTSASAITLSMVVQAGEASASPDECPGTANPV
ncbi:hypothetical protein [Xenorhabdus cabanillasii]|nr:hypothetical protein [Xenorhabdus cabanillasii]